MKALIYDGEETLGFREAPDAEPRAGEYLIRVEAVGICGSDMHAYLGHDPRRPAPLILGHEAAGTIVGGPKDGTRVTINPLVVDLTCDYVKAGRENLSPTRQLISMPPREGAFAQYVAMPERNLVEVPEGVDMAKAAMAEPLAVSWHTVRLTLEALHPTMEKRALIIGGGAIGLATALAFRAMGVEDISIIEPNALRAAFLRDRCAETVIDKPDGLYPMVVDAVGYEATRAIGCEAVAPGGIFAHVGLGDHGTTIDVRRFTLQEISFIGTYCYTAQDFRDTAQAIFEGRLGPLDWMEPRALSDGWQAFKDLRAGKVAAPKIVLDPFA